MHIHNRSGKEIAGECFFNLLGWEVCISTMGSKPRISAMAPKNNSLTNHDSAQSCLIEIMLLEHITIGNGKAKSGMDDFCAPLTAPVLNVPERAYLAGCCLSGELAACNRSALMPKVSTLASHAVEAADAIIEELRKPKPTPEAT